MRRRSGRIDEGEGRLRQRRVSLGCRSDEARRLRQFGQRGASADAYEQLGYQALAGAVVSLAAPRTPKPFIDAILYGQKVTVAFFGFVEPRKQINKPLRQLLPSARF
jgi:hypothetical protein